MTRPLPGANAPTTAISLIDGTSFTFGPSDHFTLIDFYRGLHCPICKGHLTALNSAADEFEKRGVRLITASMDTKERAETAKVDWGLDRIDVGYGMTEDDARAWGLYISQSIKDGENNVFSEPGTYLLRDDGSVYMATTSSAPFLRPGLDRIILAVDMAKDKGYPPRGTA